MLAAEKIKKILSHPNTLTLYRIIASPIIIILLLFPGSRICTFLAAIIFSAAAITDFLDGYLARQRGLVSTLGKIIDPLADKLLISSAFIMMTYHGWVPAWVVCIIIGREFAVTGLRNIIIQRGEDVSSSWLGKYKVGFQIASIIPLLLHYDYFTFQMHKVGTFLLWIALIMTVWSGVDYFVRFRKLIQE